jgi:O-antigen/teichoic acid export membrane protein
MDLAKRSITSVFWTTGTSFVSAAVLFVRSVLLARELPVEVFGVYSLAGSIVALSVILTNFGMGGAFMHRAPETEDEGEAAATHFTLKSIFVFGWLILITGGAFIFTEGSTRVALLLLAAVNAGLELTQTPKLILRRRVVHRRLALIQFVNALLTTAVALTLAYSGVTLWALLATDIVTLVLFMVGLYVWRPVWRPRFNFSRQRVDYFLRFGSRTFLAAVLLKALDRVDDLWTGLFLGETPLGFYSRAYRFATYPRSILAMPVGAVAGGTYAELKGQPKRLSQAFFRVNALLVRTGFFFAGVLALIAPEFIRLLLGAKWLPMLDAFRLMLIFTLFDPVKATVSSLFVAVGEPERVVKTRVVQIIVLVLGLFLLGIPWGITGVALAVDIMLIVGMGLLFLQARHFVRFSLIRLFAAPALSLAVSLLLARLAIDLPGARASDWHTAGVKLFVFSGLYGGILFLLERKQLMMLYYFVKDRFQPEATG